MVVSGVLKGNNLLITVTSSDKSNIKLQPALVFIQANSFFFED